MAATVISFPAPHKCRPGSLAFHPEYGVCEVIGASGAKRTVLYEERVPDLVPDTSDLEPDEDPESILSSATITIHEIEVDVNELREQDFPRDPMKQPLSRILGMNGRISLLSPRRPMDTRPRTPSKNHDQAVKMDMLHAPARCPVGALVHHHEYGICEVIAVDGPMRTIEYEVRESEFKASPENSTALAACLALSEMDDESDWNESISAYEAVVHVDELRWLRARVALAEAGPCVLDMNTKQA